jgi:hypothetical protein
LDCKFKRKFSESEISIPASSSLNSSTNLKSIRENLKKTSEVMQIIGSKPNLLHSTESKYETLAKEISFLKSKISRLEEEK